MLGPDESLHNESDEILLRGSAVYINFYKIWVCLTDEYDVYWVQGFTAEEPDTNTKGLEGVNTDLAMAFEQVVSQREAEMARPEDIEEVPDD